MLITLSTKQAATSAISLPLCPASLTHMHPVGRKDQLIELKMFLWNILFV